jgi:16S rRNA (uracil1498-N3)-methyltransferase
VKMKKAAPWFYHDGVLEPGQSVTLADDEARHAVGSRRLEKGDALTVFDGRGTIADAIVTDIGNRGRKVVLEVSGTQTVHLPVLPIHLASALPKGDRLAVMLDMATQLGMNSFTPLDCEHSVVKVSENAERRWQRILVEACKQSRRPHLPVIQPALGPVALVQQLKGAVWIAHPDGISPASLPQAAGDSLTILIGPEGGFADEEVKAACDHGAHKVSLGAGMLRIETAAVALLAYARLRFAADE